jgi:pheromone shutdown-related protein TraB
MLQTTPVRENVDKLEIDGRTIYLVGTAHVSAASAELVTEVIREFRPTAVAVELCEARFQSLQDPERWKNTDILTVLKQRRGYVLIAQLLLAAFQKRLGNKLKIKPGAEMLSAIAAARELGCPIVNADRDVKVTLKRTWSALGFWGTFRLLFSLFSGVFEPKAIEAEDIERLKTADALEEVMHEFSQAFPSVRRTLIDERDQYLAMKIKHAPGPTMVAVVGAGHVPGILKWISEEVDLAPLETIPKPTLLKRALQWLIPIIVIGMLLYAGVAFGPKASLDMFSTWFWINGLFAAAGAILALGHPLSVLASFLAAPFTALHPLIAPGWIAGIVEALVRKPRVADFATIADDAGSFKGWWHNRVTRILLVLILTSLTGRIGIFVGAWMVARAL